MTNIYSPTYDSVREIINNMKENGQEWETIKTNYESLKMMAAISKDVDKGIWEEIVKEQQQAYNKPKDIERRKADTTIIFEGEDIKVTVPKDPRSSWQLYREKLLNDGWRKEAVDKLEETTLSFLKKLNKNTVKTGPVKGLVIGQVQSGKTASMAALMAMSSDWGWNTFFVLSGMIENLRKQTQERLISDLGTVGNTAWVSLSKLSKNIEIGQQLQTLAFEEGAHTRYLNVCLKNKSRLEDLISWLESDKNKLKQMKILVIDDEADQASVNTRKIDKAERAKINELIIKLVEIGKSSNSEPSSMNYISYTATPYSNFLNESSRESLYPRDFIGMLPESNEYFGPKQIFGLEDSDEYEGLDIVRQISEYDLTQIKDLQEENIQNIPGSLRDSICWFFCAASAMRLNGYAKPISMLVHTSQKQIHHTQVSNAIASWISNTKEATLIELCRNLYEGEIERFNKEVFKEGYKEYPVPVEKLNDYPKFTELVKEILELKSEISYIKMDEEGELTYHEGIHLCVDNCANNGITDEDMHIRLAYPSKKKLKKLKKAPVFIVVGGSTLSRGLTIEGLVSTYFLRAATAGDSLMQMGRWFGYRKGYELFPRIWLTTDTYDKFSFLTTLESELRDELQEFALDNKSPSEYGPRVKNTPKVSWLRVTAKNKMQQAEEVEMDFTGTSIQTIHFENNRKKLVNNLEVTNEFLKSTDVDPRKSYAENSVVYEGVDFEQIKNNLLLKLEFNQRGRVFNQIETFCEWYEKVQGELEFKNWNVIIAGSGKVLEKNSNKEENWNIGKYSLGKVNRSAKKTSMNYSDNVVNIGVLRGPNDVFADIKSRDFFDDKAARKGVKNSEIEKTRKEYGLENVPQLIIYRIDKDSTARSSEDGNSARMDLQFKEDIIGVYINVPGSSSSSPHAKGLRVKIENNDNEE